jgi:hypothetical protein
VRREKILGGRAFFELRIENGKLIMTAGLLEQKNF